jgi:hypothetical protein
VTLSSAALELLQIVHELLVVANTAILVGLGIRARRRRR